MTRAPEFFASWTRMLPTPPAAAVITTVSAGRMFDARCRPTAVRPSASNAVASARPSPAGDTVQVGGRSERHAGVATRAAGGRHDARADPAGIRVRPDGVDQAADPVPEDDGKGRRWADPAPGADRRVDEGDGRGLDHDADLPCARKRVRQRRRDQHLGGAGDGRLRPRACHPHDGSHIRAVSSALVMGSPTRIGHSQTKFATTSPT